MSMLIDFFSLIYPQVCVTCGSDLVQGESVLCLDCVFHLPQTNYHLQEDNPVIRHFWGRVPVKAATSMYFFNKGERVQALMHKLKYKGATEIGEFAGRMMGQKLATAEGYRDSQIIIPVPLHKSKQLKRGYNQSECLAKGLAHGLKAAMVADAVVRGTASDTQTKKTRFLRWQNVDSIFSVVQPQKLEGMNILLVDDVITTGSTLEACAQAILEVPGTTVRVATMACA